MLSKGGIYPSAADQARIKKETFYENLLLNNTTGIKYIRDTNGKLMTVPVDPLVPIPQTMADINADLLMGEFPNIILPEGRQDEWNEWAFDVDLGARLLEGATYVSAVGTVFTAMYRDEDGFIDFDMKAANNATWTEKRRVLQNIKFILSQQTSENGNDWIYEIQEWGLTDGQLVIEHYSVKSRKSDSKVIEVIELEEAQRPGLDFIPSAKWLNVGVMGQANGRSDYSGKTQLFSEIDNRIDQNNDVLEENAEPWKAMPPGVLNPDGQLNKADFSNKMFEKTLGGQADNSVDIVTWDAQMAASFQQIDTMIDMVFFTGRLSNSLTGREKGGVSESGRALKWKSVSTIAMKQRKERYATNFLLNFINQWSRITGSEIPKSEIRIEWQDGLPIDEQEKTETVVQQVNAGLMSKETAIKQLQEIDDEEARRELERIQADQSFAVETEARALSPVVV